MTVADSDGRPLLRTVPGHRQIRGPAGFVDLANRPDEYIYEDCWRYMFTHPIASANGSPKL